MSKLELREAKRLAPCSICQKRQSWDQKPRPTVLGWSTFLRARCSPKKTANVEFGCILLTGSQDSQCDEYGWIWTGCKSPFDFHKGRWRRVMYHLRGPWESPWSWGGGRTVTCIILKLLFHAIIWGRKTIFIVFTIQNAELDNLLMVQNESKGWL